MSAAWPICALAVQAQTRGGGVTSTAILREALQARPVATLFTGHTMNMCREGVYTVALPFHPLPTCHYLATLS